MTDSPAARVRSFYAALNDGDRERVVALVAGEATAFAAARLGDGRASQVEWTIESLIADGPVVATECTLTWKDEDGERVAEHKSEWFSVRSGLIEAIRSYDGPEDTGKPFTEDDFDWSLLETDDDEL